MKLILTLCCLFLLTTLNAQIKGLVQGLNSSSTEILVGAKITLLHANMGTKTNEEGVFELVLPKSLPDTLVFFYPGYYPDSIVLYKKDRFIALNILLKAEVLFGEITVEGKKATHGISKMKTLHVEELTAGELRKAACCNLSESFETNASVDVNITDAVSGAKKIQMMGINGVYTQIQLENTPYLRGLESSFGLNTIPGTWVESIQITKGTGNVVNGYESMAGLINLELKKPNEMERLYVNAYQNRFGRSEVNVNAGQVINKKWSTGSFVHASAVYGNIDENKDGFRDLPMGNNLSFLNRWKYQGDKMEAQIGLNLYRDQKMGGQTSFLRDNPVGYGVIINSRHADIIAKTGFFMKKPMRSIGVIYNLKYQDIEGKFGNRIFSGTEKRGYINTLYEDILGTSDHKIKLGASLVMLQILQEADSIIDKRTEIVPGAFAEYTYSIARLSCVLGTRIDYHNLYGWQFVPRIHAKYSITPTTDFRITAGKGWRVPNYIIDNVSLLASSKQWVTPSEVRPEISWNFGGSLVQEFKLFKRKASITIDAYRTFFVNQLIIDRDENPNKVVFNNLSSPSISNSFQTELSINPLKNLEIRIAYKLLDVKAMLDGKFQQQIMLPKHRGFINVAVKSKNKRWEYDLTCTAFGKSRLPTIDVNLPIRYSPSYPMINTQITHVFKNWDFYLGVENLTNFTQKTPVVDPTNPFGNNFDATNVWGPIIGTNIYAGIRYSILRKKIKK
jgi:outer membrane receptor for ferrienterochelin and colicins